MPPTVIPATVSAANVPPRPVLQARRACPTAAVNRIPRGGLTAPAVMRGIMSAAPVRRRAARRVIRRGPPSAATPQAGPMVPTVMPVTVFAANVRKKAVPKALRKAWPTVMQKRTRQDGVTAPERPAATPFAANVPPKPVPQGIRPASAIAPALTAGLTAAAVMQGIPSAAFARPSPAPTHLLPVWKTAATKLIPAAGHI